MQRIPWQKQVDRECINHALGAGAAGCGTVDSISVLKHMMPDLMGQREATPARLLRTIYQSDAVVVVNGHVGPAYVVLLDCERIGKHSQRFSDLLKVNAIPSSDIEMVAKIERCSLSIAHIRRNRARESRRGRLKKLDLEQLRHLTREHIDVHLHDSVFVEIARSTADYGGR